MQQSDDKYTKDTGIDTKLTKQIKNKSVSDIIHQIGVLENTDVDTKRIVQVAENTVRSNTTTNGSFPNQNQLKTQAVENKGIDILPIIKSAQECLSFFLSNNQIQMIGKGNESVDSFVNTHANAITNIDSVSKQDNNETETVVANANANDETNINETKNNTISNTNTNGEQSNKIVIEHDEVFAEVRNSAEESVRNIIRNKPTIMENIRNVVSDSITSPSIKDNGTFGVKQTLREQFAPENTTVSNENIENNRKRVAETFNNRGDGIAVENNDIIKTDTYSDLDLDSPITGHKNFDSNNMSSRALSDITSQNVRSGDISSAPLVVSSIDNVHVSDTDNAEEIYNKILETAINSIKMIDFTSQNNLTALKSGDTSSAPLVVSTIDNVHTSETGKAVVPPVSVITTTDNAEEIYNKILETAINSIKMIDFTSQNNLTALKSGDTSSAPLVVSTIDNVHTSETGKVVVPPVSVITTTDNAEEGYNKILETAINSIKMIDFTSQNNLTALKSGDTSSVPLVVSTIDNVHTSETGNVVVPPVSVTTTTDNAEEGYNKILETAINSTKMIDFTSQKNLTDLKSGVSNNMSPIPQEVTTSDVSNNMSPIPQEVTTSVVSNNMSPIPQEVTTSVVSNNMSSIPHEATTSVVSNDMSSIPQEVTTSDVSNNMSSIPQEVSTSDVIHTPNIDLSGTKDDMKNNEVENDVETVINLKRDEQPSDKRGVKPINHNASFNHDASITLYDVDYNDTNKLKKIHNTLLKLDSGRFIVTEE
jgi:hypothetical protein